MSKLTNMYDKELRAFTDAMQYKLHVNRSKGKWEGMKLEDLFTLLLKEVDELKKEIYDSEPNQIAIQFEAADIANFALMIANVATRISTGELNPDGSPADQAVIKGV